MIKLKPIYLFVALAAIALTGFVNAQDGPIDKIIAALDDWRAKLPQEKVYLHTDRAYYSYGDTIYFKGYLTTGSKHNLSGISGALYVDLVNEKDIVEKTLKLPVLAGMAKGSFVLDGKTTDGNYRLRAYTDWMRNAGSDYFYDHTFAVLKPDGVYSRIDYKFANDKNKPLLQAVINFTSADGKPMANADVKCEVRIPGDKTPVIRRGKTDAQGNVLIDLPESKSNATGRYIVATIGDEKTGVVKIFSVTTQAAQPDVQFFPEGGELVYGINCRLGFKAAGANGKGIDIKGTIIDNAGQDVGSFASTHAGMGSFFLMPEAGKTYSAKVSLPDGSAMVVPLSKPVESGYVLSVFDTPGRDSILVRVYASAGLIQAAPMVALIGQTGGEVFYGSQFKVSRPMTSIWVPKKPFPSGVAQFTLFNDKSEPLNERVAFISNSDSLKLAINTSKAQFKTREGVDLQLQALDADGKPTIGGFSVSVVNESKSPVLPLDESTIFTNILLASDLKGYIEQPNYYFSGDQATTAKDLDNLMLTQGYRRFVWKDLLSGQPLVAQYKAEKLETEISGQLLTLGGKPLPNGKVILFSLQSNIMKDTVADANGNFSFKALLPDSVKFSVQGRGPNNSAKLEVKLNKVLPQANTPNLNKGEINTDIYGTRKAFLDAKKGEEDLLRKMGKLNNVQALDEVSITAKKKVSTLGYIGLPESAIDHTFVPEIITTCSALWICLQGQLPGVVFKQDNLGRVGPSSRNEAMMVYVDGTRLTEDEADAALRNGLAMEDILRIDLARTSIVAQTILGGPAIIITTKRGFVRSSNEPSITNISPKGYNKIKEFYSPNYDVNNDKTMPDLRTTIYWNPNVKTGTDGKASMRYFNADAPGRYRVTVEGISAAGQLGRKVFYYNVQ